MPALTSTFNVLVGQSVESKRKVTSAYVIKYKRKLFKILPNILPLPPKMADLMRLGTHTHTHNVDVVIQKDKLGSPNGSDDGNLAALGVGVGVGGMTNFGGMMATGGFDLNDLAQELDQDEFDGLNMINGE
uniref:Uncharacterized protein n=1 Tax=Glossina pallidipes TaxID=7398 RepID=A0A1B0A278_GLOPL